MEPFALDVIICKKNMGKKIYQHSPPKKAAKKMGIHPLGFFCGLQMAAPAPAEEVQVANVNIRNC